MSRQGKEGDGEREGRRFARRLTTIPGNGEKEQGGARLLCDFPFITHYELCHGGGGKQCVHFVCKFKLSFIDHARSIGFR